MEKILYIIALLSVLTDLFLMGTIVGFFQKKVVYSDFIKFFIPATLVSVVLLLGLFLGHEIKARFTHYEIWYAATILFIFSFKLMYDGIKLNALKKSINPIATKGLFYLSILAAINVWFIGVAFGLLSINYQAIVYSAVSIYMILVAGYLKGFGLKKLMNFRNDLFFAAIFLIIAIIIATKL